MVTSNRLVNRIIFYCLLSLTIFMTMFPFLVMLGSSLKYSEDHYAIPPTIFPDRITFEHYISILDPATFPFLTYFMNSFMVSMTTAVLSVVIGCLGAYSFARLQYKGRSIIQNGVLVIYMFSGILLVVPLFQMITKIGLYDTKLSLIITYLVLTLPVSLYMLGNYFRTIPEALEEAALIDGLNRFQLIYKIIIPLSVPAIVTVFIYVFMISWNEYMFASVFLITEESMTLPIGLSKLFFTKHYIWGRMMAASILTAIPIVVMFLALEKFIAGGLTFGGVKE